MISKKPRISLFLLDLPCGGVEQVMLHLSQGFVECGLAVDLVLARATGSFLSRVSPQVRVVDLKACPMLTSSLNLVDYLRMFASLPGLMHYLRSEQPIALLSAKDHANVVALWAKQLAKVPTQVMISVHVPPSKTSPNGTKGRFMPYLVERFYPWADGIIAVSHGVALDVAHTVGLPLEHIKVIYNPVVTPELLKRAKEPVDHPWFAPGEPPVILGVGRLTRQKDFSTLIRAFALVRQHCTSRLMILGDGEEKPQLEVLVRELGLESEVTLPGFIENPYAYMAQSAVFVLSSAWEGLPTVLIEALAIGIPVVSTDCQSGPREILQDGRLGQLVPVMEVAALAEAILTVLGKPKSAVSQETVKPFTLDFAVDSYLSVLQM